MNRQFKFKPNFIFIFLICVFVIVEIIFLRPASVEKIEQDSQTMFPSIESMVEAQKQKDEVGYTIDGFHYTAVEGEIKHWEIHAKEAVLFEKSRIVRALRARIKMFDSTGKITHIEGDDAYYKMGSRDIDLEGHVLTVFPDGLWIKTDKAHYDADRDLITSHSDFEGQTNSDKGELMQMWGTGFSAPKAGPEINVFKNSHVKIRRKSDDQITDVRSDLSRVNRMDKTAHFTMAAPDRFVKSMQGTLYVQSRRQEATYDSSASVLKYMTALDDVTIQETDVEKSKEGLKYATCQKADFLTQEDKILLTGFPSAYQGDDIVTGETIIIHRSTNLVEVLQANAFHQAKEEPVAEPAKKKKKTKDD